MIESLQPIADHIWFYPHNPDSDSVQPGVGIIITPNETVLVDAGNSPRHARQIRAVLRQMEAPPVRYVIYTHHHWDHTFGAHIWDGSRVVAHEQCHTLLHEHYGNRPWSRRYIQEQSYLNPLRAPALRAMDRAIDDWGKFHLVPPQITFTDDLTLFLDGLTIRLSYIGGQHAADSLLVKAGDVLFVGDCFYPPPPHLRQPGDTFDFEMIAGLLNDSVQTYIDAHSGPCSHAEFTRRLDLRGE